MNSEELEASLRTEFEHYINGVRAELKQEFTDFQKMVDTEVDKHRSQLDDAFKNFSARLESDKGIDEALRESVVEHLRLARDDGALLAASAADQAEMMTGGSSGSEGFANLRDAISEISGKTSQSAILKTLTDHCSRLAGRGAFFIIKNDNFVGWQVFGKDVDANESTARDIHFSVNANTILSKSVNELETVFGSAGSYKEDSKFLKSLKFGTPENMYAIPLIARGRGVAVLYADGGPEGAPVQVDAIEALVRVAGLTVELLASAPVARPAVEPSHPESVARVAPAESVESDPGFTVPADFNEDEKPQNEYIAAEEFSPAEEPVVNEEVVEETLQTESESESEPEVEEVEYIAQPESAIETQIENVHEVVDEQDQVERIEEALTDTVPVVVSDSADDESYLMTDAADHVIEAEAVSSLQDIPETITESQTDETTDFAFVSVEGDASVSENEQKAESAENEQESVEFTQPEPEIEVKPVAALNVRKRSRMVDLPIEVADEEKDKHKKARSFARLLVSEIKLYNPEKVSDGKQSNDLYERLREAIDRSREMYNQRVEPPVTDRFDYFHYELVNGLAEGDEARLGSNYPGSPHV